MSKKKWLIEAYHVGRCCGTWSPVSRQAVHSSASLCRPSAPLTGCLVPERDCIFLHFNITSHNGYETNHSITIYALHALQFRYYSFLKITSIRSIRLCVNYLASDTHSCIGRWPELYTRCMCRYNHSLSWLKSYKSTIRAYNSYTL
jgi:hypothetical protein